ncbi:transaldolase family protein [Petrotoga sp. 9PW.55.5.1]|uniref:transaldolase family protein n=1 Tax=Petrotoga sp. 9PW.55.5.1 TaxID=1308979 RepID=UPI0018F39A97|nr:transaldolase family protein [Petrotoga sp. 9PW.55.5.1]
MKLFLDSAKLDEIKYAIEKWGIEGVTSNPKHIKNSGRSMEYFMDEVKKIVESTEITVSVEVNPHLIKAEDMAEEAKKNCCYF